MTWSGARRALFLASFGWCVFFPPGFDAQAQAQTLTVQPAASLATPIFPAPGADEIEVGKSLVASDPTNALARYSLGYSLEKKGRLSEAIVQYRLAIKFDPTFPGSHIRLGMSFAKSGRPEDSVLPFRRALELNPKDAETWYNLGVSLGQMHRPAEAQDAYEHSLGLDPANFDGWFNIGLCFSDTDQPQAAIISFSKALELQPDNSEAHFQKGRALLQYGDIEGAKAEEAVLRKTDPSMATKLARRIRSPGKPLPVTGTPTGSPRLPPNFLKLLETFKRMPFGPGGTR